MIEVLNYQPTLDHTKSLVARDIAGVVNQSVTINNTGDHLLTLSLTGLCQVDPLLHQWIFNVIIDDSTQVDFPTLSLRNSDIVDRNNATLILKTSLTAGSRNLRIQWRRLLGVSELDVDGDSKLSLSIAAAAGSSGDNLGNHTATQNLDLASNNIINVGLINSLDIADLLGPRTATAVSVQTSGAGIYGVTNTAAPRTITLATADVVDVRVIIVKDESGAASSNNITIDTQAAETIDGAASIAITADFGVLKLYSDGSNWFSL